MRGQWRILAAIGAGGAIGALARALLARAGDGASWPWPTLAANLAGTALLAYGATRMGERLAPALYQRPFLATGLCGALTTFSTLQIELIRLWRDGRPGVSLAYGAASVALGLTTVWLATGLVRRARVTA